MATKITFVCSTLDGTKNLSFNYANPDVSTANVKAARTAIVTNGSIYTPAISAITGAYLTTTTREDIDIDS